MKTTLQSNGIEAGYSLAQQKQHLQDLGFSPKKVAKEIGVSINDVLTSTHITRKFSQNRARAPLPVIRNPHNRILEIGGTSSEPKPTTQAQTTVGQQILGGAKALRWGLQKLFLPGLAKTDKPLDHTIARIALGCAVITGGVSVVLALPTAVGLSLYGWFLINQPLYSLSLKEKSLRAEPRRNFKKYCSLSKKTGLKPRAIAR